MPKRGASFPEGGYLPLPVDTHPFLPSLSLVQMFRCLGILPRLLPPYLPNVPFHDRHPTYLASTT